MAVPSLECDSIETDRFRVPGKLLLYSAGVSIYDIGACSPICKIAILDYEADAVGCLSIQYGDPIFLHVEEYVVDFDGRCLKYIFGENGRTSQFGWFPALIALGN